jgi:hypothetical protein
VNRCRCATGQQRQMAEHELQRLKEHYYAVLDGDAQEFVDFLWARRHIHWPIEWVVRLDAIAGQIKEFQT